MGHPATRLPGGGSGWFVLRGGSGGFLEGYVADVEGALEVLGSFEQAFDR